MATAKFTIEHDIPIPAAHTSGLAEALNALMDEEDGASILFTDMKDNAVRSASARIGKGKLTCRRDGDGLRVWKK